MSKVVGILLAAGSSSRFGSNKCFAQLPDGTAMGVQSAQNLSAAVDEMICVIPPDNLQLKTLFSEQGFQTEVCLKAKDGMSESLKTGVRYFQADAKVSAIVISLADMPLIKIQTYQSVVKQLKSHDGIVLLTYQGKRGHPVGFNVDFNAKFTNELMTMQGDQGARDLFQKYPKDITLLSVDDPGIHQDFDTLSMFEQYVNE